MDLKGYVISCNGGLIRDIETGEILYSKVMDKISVKEIITYCMEYNINFLIYTTDVVLSNKNNPRAAKFENLNKRLQINLQVPIKYVNNRIIENINDIDAIKILLVSNDRKHVTFLEDHFSKNDNLTVLSSMNGLLDIMASNISKGKALKILSKKLDVDLAEVIAFGDNYNDIDMLKCVGMPIAMENSVEDLKVQAKYVTKTNNESGIAFAINNYIL